MIQFQNVSFAYAGRKVLRNITCQWQAGRVIGLVGPNGSGKSTCLRLGTGLLAPENGQILLGKQDVSKCSPKEIARQTAYLAQRQAVPGMTVQTLVEQGRYPYTGLGHRLSPLDRKQVAEALAVTGMSGLAARPLASLSGGQQQKAYLAMLVAQQAQHILLDEPLTYLDIRHQLEVLELLRQMADRGCAVVAVLHDLTQAMEWCDTLQVLHEGTLIYDGLPRELLSSGALETAFGVQPQWREGLHFSK